MVHLLSLFPLPSVSLSHFLSSTLHHPSFLSTPSFSSSLLPSPSSLPPTLPSFHPPSSRLLSPPFPRPLSLLSFSHLSTLLKLKHSAQEDQVNGELSPAKVPKVRIFWLHHTPINDIKLPQLTKQHPG